MRQLKSLDEIDAWIHSLTFCEQRDRFVEPERCAFGRGRLTSYRDAETGERIAVDDSVPPGERRERLSEDDIRSRFSHPDLSKMVAVS